MAVVGIIGGGIGGLAVAWNLVVEGQDSGTIPEIHIFEKNDRFGGNANTKQFDFGKGPGYEDAPLMRWADMGVNDFNTAAYQNIVKVMDQIGFTKENGSYRNLEDSTTYFNTKGHAVTSNTYKDANGADQLDPWWGTAMAPDLYASVTSFMEIGGKDAELPKFHDYTMEQYIQEQSPVHNWVPELGPEVIYPRVNGMYFTSGPLGPRSMPFAAVMHYYKIQEGAGGIPADRNYFVGGADKWIDALVGYMADNMPQITFHTGWDARITRDTASGGYNVSDASGKNGPLAVGSVVLATPADIALRIFTDGLPAKAANIMSQIKYEVAVSVAHTDTRLMPVNRNAWSTYNIVIHEPGSVALKPYTIHYVANRHQNDKASNQFNKFGAPEFFLSINPHIPVSPDKVLKDAETGEPAVANLSHFVFDFDCMAAQHDIEGQQGAQGIYYASGWTHGSGLHTECWSQGEDVAAKLIAALKTGVHEAKAPTQSQGELITSRLARSSGSI